MNSWTFHSADEDATQRLGAALAERVPTGCVVALNGPLGAGKTRLVQAIAVAWGVDVRDVVSPTYVVIHQYQADRPLYHFDVYRIEDDDEFLELGPDEYFESDGLTLIEWADRVVRCLPRERLEVRIEVESETARKYVVSAVGEKYEGVVESLQAWGEQ